MLAHIDFTVHLKGRSAYSARAKEGEDEISVLIRNADADAVCAAFEKEFQ